MYFLTSNLTFTVDWVADKVRSKFAFPGICWARSFIPWEIWQVGDETSNIIESLHSDVNRKGLSCTLLGGITKGQHFDTLKEKTLEVPTLCLFIWNTPNSPLFLSEHEIYWGPALISSWPYFRECDLQPET